jgi:hypothetical protein
MSQTEAHTTTFKFRIAEDPDGLAEFKTHDGFMAAAHHMLLDGLTVEVLDDDQEEWVPIDDYEMDQWVRQQEPPTREEIREEQLLRFFDECRNGDWNEQ